jgi:hypothetical protein
MVLNIGATILLLRSSFGQSAAERNLDQTPIAAEVTVQENNPLRISIVSVDNSNPDPNPNDPSAGCTPTHPGTSSGMIAKYSDLVQS